MIKLGLEVANTACTLFGLNVIDVIKVEYSEGRFEVEVLEEVLWLVVGFHFGVSLRDRRQRIKIMVIMTTLGLGDLY